MSSDLTWPDDKLGSHLRKESGPTYLTFLPWYQGVGTFFPAYRPAPFFFVRTEGRPIQVTWPTRTTPPDTPPPSTQLISPFLCSPQLDMWSGAHITWPRTSPHPSCDVTTSLSHHTHLPSSYLKLGILTQVRGPGLWRTAGTAVPVPHLHLYG